LHKLQGHAVALYNNGREAKSTGDFQLQIPERGAAFVACMEIGSILLKMN
jgi:hypothetical protein